MQAVGTPWSFTVLTFILHCVLCSPKCYQGSLKPWMKLFIKQTKNSLPEATKYCRLDKQLAWKPEVVYLPEWLLQRWCSASLHATTSTFVSCKSVRWLIKVQNQSCVVLKGFVNPALSAHSRSEFIYYKFQVFTFQVLLPESAALAILAAAQYSSGLKALAIERLSRSCSYLSVP